MREVVITRGELVATIIFFAAAWFGIGLLLGGMW